MELKITSLKFGDKPQPSKPSPNFLTELGEEGVRRMVSRHYDLLVESSITDLFPKTPEALQAAKEHSADFMIQICGGSDYFNQHRGRPMMSARHAPFSITPEARVVWLGCYRQALLETGISDEMILSFWNYIDIFSNWMVNTPPKGAGFTPVFKMPSR